MVPSKIQSLEKEANLITQTILIDPERFSELLPMFSYPEMYFFCKLWLL